MKERPILFSAPMVRAILEGRKTQTRRAVKWPLYSDSDGGKQRIFCESAATVDEINRLMLERQRHPNMRGFCPYGQPGDRLWVRETFSQCLNLGADSKGSWPAPEGMFSVSYAATDGLIGDRWKPSIHMPRNLSRILLEVVSVRVERLQEISEADAVAEGIEPIKWPDGNILYPDYAHKAPNGKRVENCTPIRSFLTLWESINGRSSLEANPWVWVVEFKRVMP